MFFVHLLDMHSCIHALIRWPRHVGHSVADMATAVDFVEGSVHEFDLPDLDKAFQRAWKPPL